MPEDDRIGELDFLVGGGAATDFLHFSDVDIIDLSKGFVNDQDKALLCGELPKK
jgi:hypothetical protein